MWFISLLLADMWHCYGLFLAQIWQTGAVHTSAIIPRHMWPRSSFLMCQMWARAGPTICCYLGLLLQFCHFSFTFHKVLMILHYAVHILSKMNPLTHTKINLLAELLLSLLLLLLLYFLMDLTFYTGRTET